MSEYVRFDPAQGEAELILAIDQEMRQLGEDYFGVCNLEEGICKFGYDTIGCCDRSCNEPVWDQI